MTNRRLATTIAGAAGAIAVLTLLARVAGFGRILVFADSVRAGGVGEIYQSLNALPNVLVEVSAGGILAAVAVPLIARHHGAGDNERADRLASALLSWTLVVLVSIAAVVLLLARPLAALLVEPFDPRALEVGARMLRVFALQIPLYGVGFVLTGLLQARRRFVAAALAPLLSSIVVLGSYLWYGAIVHGETAPSQVPDRAVDLLAWGTTAGVVVLSLPLLGPALASGWRWRPTLLLDPRDRRAVAALAGAGVLVVAGQQLAVLAALWLANHSGDRGTFPVWQYAQTVYLLPYAVLAVPIATAAFPTLAAGGRTPGGPGEDGLTPTLARSVRAVLLVSGLGAALVMATSRPVAAFFGLLDARRGTQGASTEALSALAGALVGLAPGLIGFSVTALLLRASYVRGSALGAALAVAGGWLLAAAPVLLVGPGAGSATTLRALALASSVGMTLTAAVLAILVRRSWSPEATVGSSRTLGALIIALGLALAVGDSVTRGFPLDTFARVLTAGVLSAIAAAVVYLLAMGLGDRELLRDLRARGRLRRRAG